MIHGDFTTLAKAYKNRPGYSLLVLKIILNELLFCVKKDKKEIKVADVGAGTGKLSENLLELGLNITAIEPNEEMRKEGIYYTKNMHRIFWKKGSGENTGLVKNTIDWLLMGSSFHWVDFVKGTIEFNKVLKPGCFFTAIWNPRNIINDELQNRIESEICKMVPNLKRISSGSSTFTENLSSKLLKTGFFKNVFFLETEYEIEMSKERYIGAWHSTNDIQVQAGPEKWSQIIKMIEKKVGAMDVICVPYKTKAWTAIKK